MKYQELANLAPQELAQKISATKEQLFKLTFAHAVSPLSNSTQIRKTRREVARLKTALNSKEKNNKSL